MTTARELMSTNPVTVTTATTVREAARLLYTLEFRHLPIVDDRGKLVGMLSDRDLRGLAVPYLVPDEYVGHGQGLLDARVADLIGHGQGLLDAHVADVMSGGVLSVHPDGDAADVVDVMLENKVGAVPVVDDEGRIVGIVSYVDVLRALPLDLWAGR
jgi:acetoin utilization protein AcuB